MTALRRMGRVALAAAAALILLSALYAAAGYWLAPRLLHDALTGFARERLGHRLELRAVRVDPWQLTVAIEGARLSASDGAVLAEFERLALELEVESLWSGVWRLRELVMVAPRVEISRGASGAHNWAALLAALSRGDASPAPRVRVRRAAIEDGKIGYEDLSAPDPLRLRAAQLALEVRAFSTDESAPASYTLGATLQDGARLAAKGRLEWQTRSASGDLTLEGLSAATLPGSSPIAATRGTARASARFSIHGDARSLVVDRVEAAIADLGLAFSGGTASVGSISLEAGRYAAADGSAGFGRLRIQDAVLAAAGDAAPPLQLARLSLDAVAVSLQDRTVRVERAALAGLQGRDELDAQGASRLAGLLALSATEATPGGDPSPGWSVALRHLDAQDSAWHIERRSKHAGGGSTLSAGFAHIAAEALQLVSGAALAVAVDRLETKGGTLRHTPQGAAARTIELREIALTATQLRYPQGEPFKVGAAFVLRPAGRVSAEGEFDARTLSASLALRAEALPLAAAQPWIEPHLALRIPAGLLAVDGRLRIAPRPAVPVAQFDGQITIRGLKLEDAISREPLLGADTIQARGVKLALAPVAISIEELALQAPVGRIAIAEDGRLNLGALRPAAAKDRDESGAAGRLPLRLRRVSVRDGRLDFSDRSMRPAFAARIDELSGTVTGLEASRAGAAEVALEGRVGEYGAAKIRGALDPFELGTRTDLTLDLRNLEMTAFDPYARRFAGYRIESGKLSGDLRYRVREGRLEGENHLVIEKLKLGERVASPQAADLPLDLAIALLTDAEGRIALEVPVRGDLERLEFDFGQVIAQAVSGAIGKIVTAPFRLLAGLFGKGEEAIDRIYFSAGSAKLAPPEREKIAAVARALVERPQLELRVAAGFAGKADAEALRAATVAVDPGALLALAGARGDAVREGLVALGIDAGRIELAAPEAAPVDAKHGVPARLSLSVR